MVTVVMCLGIVTDKAPVWKNGSDLAIPLIATILVIHGALMVREFLFPKALFDRSDWLFVPGRRMAIGLLAGVGAGWLLAYITSSTQTYFGHAGILMLFVAFVVATRASGSVVIALGLCLFSYATLAEVFAVVNAVGLQLFLDVAPRSVSLHHDMPGAHCANRDFPLPRRFHGARRSDKVGSVQAIGILGYHQPFVPVYTLCSGYLDNG